MVTDAARERLISILDPELASTVEAMVRVPRHEFVPESYEHDAGAGRLALLLGHTPAVSSKLLSALTAPR